MLGDDQQQDGMFSYISPNKRVPQEHPLRRIRSIVDRVLDQLSPRFNKLYARAGRPSIAPEKLLRALLLQLLYSVRSERLLMEQLNYNLLFRWFVGLSMDDAVWDATTFSKNRDRLLRGDVARELLAKVVEEAQVRGLMSEEHFTVDGTLLKAWASQKSIQPVEGINGLHQVTVAGDKGYDTRQFVNELRDRNATPHVAQNTTNRRSAIDTRTTRHPGYAISQRKRKRIEEIFGWMKTVGLLRQLRHRGLERVGWVFTLAAATYNLVRMRTLMPKCV